MNKNILFKAFLAGCVILVLSGCATTYNPATGRGEFIFINTNSEVSIGKSAASHVLKKYKLSENTKDLARINRLGEQVAKVSDRQDLDYKFYIIEDDSFNAFTIPGGHVYIFKGLYDILDDDELGCVIGHEIGHVAARHIVKKMQASLGYQILSTIALVAYAGNQEEKKRKAGYVAYAGATAFNLVSLGYSRKDEFEADALAIKYARLSGLNPDGMVGALAKLGDRQKKGLPVPYMFRSHPHTKERIERLQKLIKN